MVLLWHHCESPSFGTIIFLTIGGVIYSLQKKKKVNAAHVHTTTVHSDLVHQVAKSTYDRFAQTFFFLFLLFW